MNITPKPATERLRPIKQLALHVTLTCVPQAKIYGKCIVATYTDVRKDVCKAEFESFARCVQAAVSITRLCEIYALLISSIR